VTSGAYGNSSNSQVGSAQYGISITDQHYHAFLWNDTATSGVDLHPIGYTDSSAFSNLGNIQVGHGSLTSSKAFHALLWKGTAASVVDLNPTGYSDSTAWGVFGNVQVGQATPTDDTHSHAMIWKGSAASALDLHPTTAGLTLSGVALNPVSSNIYGIDSNGNLVGYVQDANSKQYAVLWKKN
jgi:hypothetical protein